MSSSRDTEQSRRVVLITGASQGIGKTCAAHLARRGWRVFGTYRTSVPAATGANHGVEMIYMNVDDDQSVASGVAGVLEQARRIDAVVNNAGFGLMGSVEDTTVEEAKAQFETNFFGVLRVCRAVLPAMRRQRAGTIVNIGSLAGIIGLPFAGMYSASKFALEGLSESLRFETRPFGIRVVLVEPGDFRTNMVNARRIAAAAVVNDAYRSVFDRMRAQQDREETNAATPEPVARLVERILNDPRPKLHYSVGMWSQRIVVPLRSYLPQRVYQWLAWKLLRL
jgi:NAD(P)-dependent dehydrogenase (short-subunit alcohol dehydrogenase family)